MISLTTRPLAWGRKVWAHTYNDVMEMVFSRLSRVHALSLTARYDKSLCYALLLATACVAKWRGAMSRTVAIICIVSQLISNYLRIIAVHGDNLNVGKYPDPSFSPNERSGPRVR